MKAALILRTLRRTPATVAIVLLVGACGDDVQGPADIPDPPASPEAPGQSLSALIVSDPVTPASAAGASLSFAGFAFSEDVAFVSLPPGSVPDGETAVIQTRGTQAEATVPMLDGGFDPIPVVAIAGDTLDIRIELAGGGAPVVLVSVVPPRIPPVIVRTDPPPQKRDVPLNAVMMMVFSEPIDAVTVTASSVKLLLDGAPVAGTFAFVDDAHVALTFTPAEPLNPGAEYALVITGEVEDLDGDALEQEHRVTFHTEPPGESSLVVSNVTTGSAFPALPYVFTVALPAQPPQSRFMDLNQAVAFSVPAGDATVSLNDLPANCEAAGGASRTVTAAEGQGAAVEFSITCTPPPEFASLRLVFTRLACQGRTQWGGCSPAGGNLWTMNADGTDVRQLTDGLWDVAAAVSPDGTRIAFVRDFVNSQLHTVAADGGAVTQLTDGSGEVGWGWLGDGPVWSPDGTSIAFTVSVGDADRIDVVAADGTDRRTLIDSAWAPAWSPDGSTIAFFRGPRAEQQDYELWVMDADGGNPRPVLPVAWGAKSPAWTADGSAITFETVFGTLWTVNPDGSNPGSRDFDDAFGFCTGNWSSARAMYVKGGHFPCDPWLGYEGVIRLLTVEGGTRVRLNSDGAMILPAFFP